MDKKNVVGRVQYVFEAGCEHQEEANKILANISRSEELKEDTDGITTPSLTKGRVSRNCSPQTFWRGNGNVRESIHFIPSVESGA